MITPTDVTDKRFRDLTVKHVAPSPYRVQPLPGESWGEYLDRATIMPTREVALAELVEEYGTVGGGQP